MGIVLEGAWFETFEKSKMKPVWDCNSCAKGAGRDVTRRMNLLKLTATKIHLASELLKHKT